MSTSVTSMNNVPKMSWAKMVEKNADKELLLSDSVIASREEERLRNQEQALRRYYASKEGKKELADKKKKEERNQARRTNRKNGTDNQLGCSMAAANAVNDLAKLYIIEAFDENEERTVLRVLLKDMNSYYTANMVLNHRYVYELKDMIMECDSNGNPIVSKD
jgi:uncharacterized membrane protein YfhO